MSNQAKTKVITGTNTRLSYFHGWEPVSINGGAEKYSVSVLIPKSDTATVKAINDAIDAAITEGIAKFGVTTRHIRTASLSTPTAPPSPRSSTVRSDPFWTAPRCTPAVMPVSP